MSPDWTMPPDWWKRCLAEFVGTFGLTFVAAAVICTDRYAGGEVGLVGIALAHGAVLAVLITALAHVSGGHVNPAVTLGVLLSRAIRPSIAVLYVISQIAGATVAGGVLARTFSTEVWEPVALGAPVLGPGVAFSTGIFVEAALSFFLILVFLQTGVDDRAPQSAHGFAVGSVLVFDVLVGGPLTGAAVNPARAFGPALVAAAWADQLVWWIGPAAGAVVAALGHNLLQPAATPDTR